MSIATKTGDQGTTGLMYGRRVSKFHLRVEAYGTVDELNSALGTVRATLQANGGDPFITEPIFSIQKELVTLMGELAVAPEDRARYAADGYAFVQAQMVDALTELIEDLENNKKVSYKYWATPGFNAPSAALDVARTVCRRAERRVVELSEQADALVNPEIIRYLNRLSDLCWLYARHIETVAEKEPALAQP